MICFCILQIYITFTLKCNNYIQILDKACLCKKFIHCIHRIAPVDSTGGYYGFCFVTLPPQCVERFHRYCSNKKKNIARHLKFAGYIHNHKLKNAYKSLIIGPRGLQCENNL